MPAEIVISLLGATLLATGWAMWLLPVGTCAHCAHCRQEQLARERDTEAQAARIYGIPVCRSCGRHHEREDAHRR